MNFYSIRPEQGKFALLIAAGRTPATVNEFRNVLELSLPLFPVLSPKFRVSRTAGFTETCYMEVQAQRRVGCVQSV